MTQSRPQRARPPLLALAVLLALLSVVTIASQSARGVDARDVHGRSLPIPKQNAKIDVFPAPKRNAPLAEAAAAGRVPVQPLKPARVGKSTRSNGGNASSGPVIGGAGASVPHGPASFHHGQHYGSAAHPHHPHRRLVRRKKSAHQTAAHKAGHSAGNQSSSDRHLTGKKQKHDSSKSLLGAPSSVLGPSVLKKITDGRPNRDVAANGVSDGSLEAAPDAVEGSVGTLLDPLIDGSDDSTAATGAPTVGTLRSGVRFLYHNDFDWVRAINPATRQPGYLLLTGQMGQEEASSACQQLGESLALAPVAAVDQGLKRQLNGLQAEGFYAAGQEFWAAAGTVRLTKAGKLVPVLTGDGSGQQEAELPALCTQSAPFATTELTDNSERWQVGTKRGQLSIVGYRDALSFRFGSVPYANPPKRFARSTPASRMHGTVSAISNDAALACPQVNGGNWDEDGCLVANIATNWLPSAAEQAAGKGLRPILIFIHGGGFRSGSGLDPTFAGGNLASRSDLVVITPNYRLGTLGWLAVNDDIPGNFGLSDILSLLKWVRQNAAAFGGDASRVTVAGQSSGAQLVQVLLRSPAAEGLFHRAIIQSGRPYDQANNRQDLYTAAAEKGEDIVNKLGCDADSDALLECLRALPARSFLGGQTMSNPVVDFDLVPTAQIDLSSPAASRAHVNRVPILTGYMRDEMGSLGRVPSLLELDVDSALAYAGISRGNRSTVLANPDTFPNDLLTRGAQGLAVGVATDILSVSRCGQEASLHAIGANGVFPATYAYVFDSSYQIDWDPNGVCSGSLDVAQVGLHCHSGDLLPVFSTLGYWQKPYRPGDQPWIRAVSDQWASFVRDGTPNPSKSFMRLRNFAAPSGDAWEPVGRSSQTLMTLATTQRRRPLGQYEAQCNALNRPLSYIMHE